MSVERRLSSSSDTRTLLEERPPSYHSTDDVNNPPPPPIDAINKFSRADTCWILAGLWTGVLLGAFDGTHGACLSKNLTINHSLPPGTVVATLLSPIGSEFKASNQSSYIGTAYLLSVCCFTPLYGQSCQSYRHLNQRADCQFRTIGRYPWP